MCSSDLGAATHAITNCSERHNEDSRRCHRILKRAVGHTPKSKTLDEVYLHPKATQMIEAFDKANQLVNDEVLTTTKA